jgi:hypothetical protein
MTQTHDHDRVGAQYRVGDLHPSALPPHAEPLDPRLDLIVERVQQAARGFDISGHDVDLIVNETLWQIGYLIRRGAVVEVPELGTFHRHQARPDEVRIDFTPDPQLLGGLVDAV